MKFFHVSDLHFGKTLYDVRLVEKDQPYWIDQFLKAVDEHQPDVVVIAGDIYDRKQPSDEAIVLFERLLSGLAKRGKTVFVVPGNHDSNVKLSQFSEFLEEKNIFIAREVKKEIEHHEVGGVVFWLMPFFYPLLVADTRVFDDPDIDSYDKAARALIEAQDIDTSKCNVIISHQNVIADGVKPVHSDSESSIGGVGEIEYSAYDKFDYVALGHIHNGQSIGRDTIIYSGCPLFYDFSEEGRDKKVVMVEVNESGRISKEDISFIDVPLLHKIRTFTGTVDDLVEEGKAFTDKNDYYVLCTVNARTVSSVDRDKLNAVFGSCLIHIGKSDGTDDSGENGGDPERKKIKKTNIKAAFEDFYQEKTGDFLDDVQLDVIEKMIEQQSRNPQSYIALSNSSENKKKCEAETDELLDFLLAAIDKIEDQNGEGEA
ncbi:MAG: exonuclease SbcCD subunit D [Saccharofermentans sp.]|nr:exonuclease SbcCD subunit D [Saccharofermentans sp.]